MQSGHVAQRKSCGLRIADLRIANLELSSFIRHSEIRNSLLVIHSFDKPPTAVQLSKGAIEHW